MIIILFIQRWNAFTKYFHWQVYLQKRGRHGFVQALLRRIKRLLSV